MLYVMYVMVETKSSTTQALFFSEHCLNSWPSPSKR